MGTQQARADQIIQSATGASLTEQGDSDAQTIEGRLAQLHIARMKDHTIDSGLKKLVGQLSMAGLVAQLVAVNAGFGFYLYHSVFTLKQQIPPEVMIAWFTSTVVEMVGVVYVVAKYLFPENGNDWNREKN